MNTGRCDNLLACIKQAGRRTCLAVVLLMVVPLSGECEDDPIAKDGWTLIEATATVRIYHRNVAGSSIPWTMIVTTFDAPPERVHAVVMDYDHFSEFIPNVFRSRLVANVGDTQWVFQHLHFHGPIADRVYLIKSSTRKCWSRKHCYRVEWALDNRPFPDIDLSSGIQPDVFSGFWELTSAGNPNTTEGHYAVHSEPGGFIPSWLVTGMTDRYIQQVVQAVRQRLE